VQHLDGPGAKPEQPDADRDERTEAADPDEEAGAAEIRRVGTRIRLGPAASGQ
jgi:hypothetical protein